MGLSLNETNPCLKRVLFIEDSGNQIRKLLEKRTPLKVYLNAKDEIQIGV